MRNMGNSIFPGNGTVVAEVLGRGAEGLAAVSDGTSGAPKGNATIGASSQGLSLTRFVGAFSIRDPRAGWAPQLRRGAKASNGIQRRCFRFSRNHEVAT